MSQRAAGGSLLDPRRAHNIGQIKPFHLDAAWHRNVAPDHDLHLRFFFAVDQGAACGLCPKYGAGGRTLRAQVSVEGAGDENGETGGTAALSLSRVQVMISAAARQLVAGSKWITKDTTMPSTPQQRGSVEDALSVILPSPSLVPKLVDTALR